MKSLKTILILAFACFAASSVHAATSTKSHVAPTSTAMHPRITVDAALAIARKRVPGGTVKSNELERENGHLIYSFDFVVPGQTGIDEVNVDAMNGAALGVSHEGPRAERKELAKEKKEAQAQATGH